MCHLTHGFILGIKQDTKFEAHIESCITISAQEAMLQCSMHLGGYGDESVHGAAYFGANFGDEQDVCVLTYIPNVAFM